MLKKGHNVKWMNEGANFKNMLWGWLLPNLQKTTLEPAYGEMNIKL